VRGWTFFAGRPPRRSPNNDVDEDIIINLLVVLVVLLVTPRTDDEGPLPRIVARAAIMTVVVQA